MFFPENKINDEWKIYNALRPSLWAANYKGFFFYMESRTECSYPALDEIKIIIDKIIKVNLPISDQKDDFKQPLKHYLRPRLIFFDNKGDDYSVYVDYLYENGDKPLQEGELKTQLEDSSFLYQDGNSYSKPVFFTIKFVSCNQVSDHFHVDHKDYYASYIK